MYDFSGTFGKKNSLTTILQFEESQPKVKSDSKSRAKKVSCIFTFFVSVAFKTIDKRLFFGFAKKSKRQISEIENKELN